MANIILTSTASLEEHAKRIATKIDTIQAELERRNTEYGYNTFLCSTVTADLEHDIERLETLKTLIELALRNPRQNVNVSFDQHEIDLIYRYEDF